MHIIVWIAVVALCFGYLAQIAKIQQHREVRDLSKLGFISLAVAYIVLGYEAYLIESQIFLIKNCVAFCLVITILVQVWYHQDDEWHDEEDASCKCGNELEEFWKFCPDCGESIKGRIKVKVPSD